jgi:hypothetical protein
MGRTFNRQRDWDRPASKTENRSVKGFDKHKKAIYNRLSSEDDDDIDYEPDEQINHEFNHTQPIQRK